MTPRAWIVAGWLFIVAAGALALVSLALVLGGGPPVACIQLAGVTCPSSGSSLLPGIVGPGFLPGAIFAVGAGVAFFSALACLFWAAHLRTLAALRALAGDRKTVPGSTVSLGE
jgi:hypothetical protein